eukprot:9693259-Karenia_brevis.AAC.1
MSLALGGSASCTCCNISLPLGGHLLDTWRNISLALGESVAWRLLQNQFGAWWKRCLTLAAR